MNAWVSGAWATGAWYGTAWYDSGGAPPVVVTPTATTASGVKKRPIALRFADMESREELANFIRSHVQIKSEPQPESPPVYKAGKKGRRQREDDRLAELAMRNMQLEAEDEIRIQYNKQALMIILLAAAYDE